MSALPIADEIATGESTDAAVNIRPDVLSIQNLKVHFATYKGTVKAIDGLTLSVKRGEVLGVVGETGCGKSVTAFSVVQLLPANASIVDGHIWFEGKDLVGLSERDMQKIRGRRISMIYQEPSTALNPVFTVGYQLIEAVRTATGMTGRKAREKAEELLKTVALPNPARIMRQYPHELSGGMKQRIMIAMALAGGPALVIADEPTTALDVTTQAEILDLMKDVQRRFQTAMILVTHDLGVVAEMCDRVAVMYAGTLAEVGPVDEIFEHPAHPYTRGLLAAIPTVSDRVRRVKTIGGTVPNLITPPAGCRFHPRCPEAKPECMAEKPELVEIGPGHRVACLARNAVKGGIEA